MTINGHVSGIAQYVPVSAQTSGVVRSQRSVTSGLRGVSSVGPIISAAPVQGVSEVDPVLYDVHAAVEKLNELAEAQKKIVSYSVDRETQTTVLRFYKNQTGELIKQYPQEEVLALKAHVSQHAGWFIDSTK